MMQPLDQWVEQNRLRGDPPWSAAFQAITELREYEQRCRKAAQFWANANNILMDWYYSQQADPFPLFIEV